jgi:formate dehydrogenase subunit delta
MEARKLVKMANEIAAFFEADPDRAAALEGIAGHLQKFWDPRMRREILKWVDDHQGEGLKPSALEAIQRHRQELLPPQATRPSSV